MPPTHLTFHILLALAADELYATGIYRQIARDSTSTLLPGERSLYRALERMKREGLIEPATLSGSYRLTKRGRRILESEKVRLQHVVTVLRERV